MANNQSLEQGGPRDPPIPNLATADSSKVRGKRTGSSSAPPKTPWVDLFKPSAETVDSSFNLRFCPPVNGTAVLDESEIWVAPKQWNFSLLGCFAGRFPGHKAIDALVAFWKVKCKVVMQPNGFVMFRFQSEGDRCAVLKNGPYFLYGKRLFLDSLPENFWLELSDYCMVPTWVRFVDLPDMCWKPEALSKIASCLGNPICMDKRTKEKKKRDFARILVEIDSSIPPVEKIPIALPNGEIIHQAVFYELFPCFCVNCKSSKHYMEKCPKLQGIPIADRSASLVEIFNCKRSGLDWRWKKGDEIVHSGGTGDVSDGLEDNPITGLDECAKDGPLVENPALVENPTLDSPDLVDSAQEDVSPTSIDTCIPDAPAPNSVPASVTVEHTSTSAQSLDVAGPYAGSNTCPPVCSDLALVPVESHSSPISESAQLALDQSAMETIPMVNLVEDGEEMDDTGVFIPPNRPTAAGGFQWSDLTNLRKTFSGLGPCANKKEFIAIQLEANRVCRELIALENDSLAVQCTSINTMSQVVDFRAALLSPPKQKPGVVPTGKSHTNAKALPVPLRAKGINKPLKKKRLLNFVRQNHVSFFGLLETRVAPIKFDKVIKGLFPSEQVFVDYSVIRSGRIILVWNSNKVECSILDVSPQCIHCLLQCKISNNTFVCSIVYGLYSVVERRDLWSKLISLRSSVSLPWMICGDFNTVKSPDEKIGGVVPTNYFTKDLVNCCTYLDVIDAPSIGNFLTWSNSRVKAKLDRVLIDPLWANGNYSCSVEFKEFDCISDHCPMLIKLFNSCVATNRPFKFFNMWLSHHSFQHILLESWNIYISGTSQYQFVQHLKALKGPLKPTEEDRTKLSDLRKRASFLAEAERQFVSQKLKFKVLIDGDKGSKYFHDLIKRSNRDKSITCILDHHGQPTTSLAQVGAIFVEHFEDLFGSASARTTCNPDFLANGPLFDNSQHDLLCKDVTNQEIKDALFAINDQKAPGPDGYSAAFFKHNWNVIGEDLIEAVREFFVSGQILKQINYTVVALVPKSQNAQRVGDFRPISCCNVLYKVISKILAARLCCVLPKLINKAQAAFIEGRSMSDNIFLAQELIRGYARKRISPRCMLMVDLRKAYDTIDWNFIFEVWSMIRNIFGFPKNTLAICSSIKWIRRLFKGTRRHSKAVAIALASTVYHIWSFRNQVIHDSYRPSLDGLVNIIATDTLRVAFSLQY
nr:uncharacterized protein LOC109184888 [Ipomoea trifida]